MLSRLSARASGATPARPPVLPSGARTGMPVRRGVPWPARLLLLAAIWGSSFLFIKTGDQALAPLQVAFARMAFGSVTLLLILAAQRVALPRAPHLWLHLAVAAFLLNALPFALFAYGETVTTSVVAGILNATAPLFTMVIAMLMLPEERPNRERVAGVGLGFLGVLVVLGVWQGLAGQALAGDLACLGAALSYGLGFPYTRKYLAGRSTSIVALATGQLLCGTVELALVLPFVSGLPAVPPAHVLASLLALGVLGTGIAYILNYGLIRDAGATLASTVTYVVPLFSTIEGALVLGEPLAWYEPIGALIVILGVALSQGRLRRLVLGGRQPSGT